MNDRMRQQPWDVSISMLRVGDLVLTRAEGAARLMRVRGEADAVTAGTAGEHISGKQAGLLAFLMRHPHQIVSKSRLIEAVWGQDGAEPGVLDVHMARLRRVLQRLDANNGNWVRIETRRGMGYALHVEESK